MPRSPASTCSTPRPTTGTAARPRALGEGLRRAFADGVERAQVFVVAKGGFLAFDDGPPADVERWFDAHVVARGLGRREDLAGQHCLSPRYVEAQLEAVRAATGLDSIDAFLLDQPAIRSHVAPGSTRPAGQRPVAPDHSPRQCAAPKIPMKGAAVFCAKTAMASSCGTAATWRSSARAASPSRP